jgi:hypothetical protein
MIEFEDMDCMKCFVCKKQIHPDETTYMISRFAARMVSEIDSRLHTSDQRTKLYLGDREMCTLFHTNCFEGIATQEYMFRHDVEMKEFRRKRSR